MGMANVLNEEKKQQVLALGRLGWSLRRIQQATRIHRETASAYLKAAGIAVRPPSGWGRRAAKPANEVITDSGTAKPAIPVIPDPLNPNTENLSTKEKATSKPANENEVITGFGVELSGSERKSPKCVSSTSFCEPYREAIELGLSRGRNAQAIWQDLVSEYSFANSYQSVQRIVVLDNLREGVLVPDLYDPALNPLYRDVLAHYGAVAMPCRIQDPDRKGKVESGVGHAQRTPLKGLRFESLQEAQAYLDRWEERWANTRARSAAGIALKKRITPSERPCALPNCCGERAAPDSTLVCSAMPSIVHKARSVCAASWVFSPWPRNTARRRSMKPAPPRWTWECRNTALSAAIWSAARKPHSVCSKSIP